MTKQQGDELDPTGHSFGMLLGLMLAHRTLKYGARDEA